MMSFLTQYITEVRDRPAEFFVGLCVLFVAVMGTSVNHVASSCYALLLLAGLFTVAGWRPTWQSLHKPEKWLLTGFMLYALSGIIAVINVQDMDEYIKDLERYLRFLFAIPMYLYLRRYRVSAVRYLYAGAIISGPFLLAVALNSYFDSPGMPARGYYHHIIFGSLAMLNVGVMLALVLVEKMSTLMRVLMVMSMAMGFTAAILSQSRGVWLVVPVYLLIAMIITWRQSRKRFAIIAVFIIVCSIAAAMSPLGKLIGQRIDAAVDEVETYYQRDNYVTSVGTRLAMWEVAIEVWKQYPAIGIGPGDFDDHIRELQAQGRYKDMPVHASTHNIYMQALVNTGLFGLVVLLLSLFYLPLKILLAAGERQYTVTLVGINILSLFAVIGISESWILRLPTVSVYIIYMIVIIAGLYAAAGGERDSRS